MTQLAFILDGKDKARIFSDTQVAPRSGEGKVVHKYKIRHLEDIGVAVTSRGFEKTLDHTVETIKGSGIASFDDLVAQAPLVLKEAMRATILDLLDDLPDHIQENPNMAPFQDFCKTGDIDEVIKLIRNMKEEDEAAIGLSTIDQEFFAVGYSERHRSMGLVLVSSFMGFKVLDGYQAGQPLFMQNDPVLQYFKGQVPKTDKQIIKGMRVSYEFEKKGRIKSRGGAVLTPQAKIKKTIVYADGRFLVKTVGPFLKK